MNYFYLGVCGKGPMWPLENRDSSASQLSPLLVSGWIYGEGVKTKRDGELVAGDEWGRE